MSSFVHSIEKSICQYSLIPRGSRVLVAVSGGADSVSLLLALYDLRHRLGFSLVVAHYDHALRASSAKESQFVKCLADRLGLEFITERSRNQPPATGSLEEFARNIRYDFLCRAMRQCRADAVAVAHTKDDLAETVLMRILRGAGLSGLRSMLPLTRRNGCVIIRPLLEETRRDVEAFLRKKDAKYVNDPTNRSLKFDRNRVRLKLIPYIEKEFAPDLKDRLAVLAKTAGADHGFIDQAGVQLWSQVARKRGKTVQIKLEEFRVLHPAMRRVILRKSVEVLTGAGRSLDLKHTDMMDFFALSARKGDLALPLGLILRKSKEGRSFSVQIS